MSRIVVEEEGVIDGSGGIVRYWWAFVELWHQLVEDHPWIVYVVFCLLLVVLLVRLWMVFSPTYTRRQLSLRRQRVKKRVS